MLSAVARADADGAVLKLRLADDQNKVVVCQAGVAHLLHQQRVLADIAVSRKALEVQDSLHLLSVGRELGVVNRREKR